MRSKEKDEASIEFLHEMARYFAKRSTKGEDKVNVYNTENCLAAANLLEALIAKEDLGEGDELRSQISDH